MRDLHIESLPADSSGFPGHRRAPQQRSQKQPLDLHLVNVGSIPTGPTHGEACLQSLPGDVLKSTPNVRKSPRSGLNLEGRLSDFQIQGKLYRVAPLPGTATTGQLDCTCHMTV